jgi:cytochrome c553
MESLAGQPKDDLLKKMLDFKSGKKPATIMHQLSKGYTDEQLEQLAGYFAALKK